MKPKEIFALFIRLLAVLGLGYVARNWIGEVLAGSTPLTVLYLGKKVAFLLVGVYFLRGAPQFVAFAYPDQQS